MRGTKKDWSDMSASKARSSRADGERSLRRTGAWLRWAREESSSQPRDFTSSSVRAPVLDFRLVLPAAAAVADDEFAMAGADAREAAAAWLWGRRRIRRVLGLLTKTNCFFYQAHCLLVPPHKPNLEFSSCNFFILILLENIFYKKNSEFFFISKPKHK
jgi:hypothetical protein